MGNVWLGQVGGKVVALDDRNAALTHALQVLGRGGAPREFYQLLVRYPIYYGGGVWDELDKRGFPGGVDPLLIRDIKRAAREDRKRILQHFVDVVVPRAVRVRGTRTARGTPTLRGWRELMAWFSRAVSAGDIP